jgi:L-threonylcarbamoyladenylate synthase
VGRYVTIDAALDALRRGLVVGLPTDTVYGLGANPLREEAQARLFTVKGRPEERAIPVLAADLDGVRLVADVGPAAEEAAARHWPGALTLVLPRATAAAPWVGDAQTATVAVRIPDHEVTLDLLSASGPLAVTSANRSGEPPALSAEEAEALLGEAVAVYLPGVCPGGVSSTVVDMTGPEPVVLRAGPVTWEDT